MFLRATFKDGTSVVSEYAKLARVQRYLAQVFTGQKPFNAWVVRGDTHPFSGEKVLMRERQMFNGLEIVKVEEVQPTVEDHGLNPANFQPVVVMAKGDRGIYTVPESVPQALAEAGVVAGMKFPKHRDPLNFRDHIIVRVGDPTAPEHSEAAQERRFYLDGMGESAAPARQPSGSGDDIDDDYDNEDEY